MAMASRIGTANDRALVLWRCIKALVSKISLVFAALLWKHFETATVRK